MKIHFIGIGGIGISALAQYYLAKGADVSGSDLVSSEITEMLEKKGVKVFIGQHKTQNILRGMDLVVYSPAVREDNPEFMEARKKNIELFSYPQALGKLSKDYFIIAISGSHGKSTTSAMIALIIIKAGFNPTVILGTKLKEFGNSNFRLGGIPEDGLENSKFKIQNSEFKFLVIEADEYQASFLNYWPNIIVLTNIEEEHLDYFGNLENIFRAFRDFVNHLPESGTLIINYDDENARKIEETLSDRDLNIVPYYLEMEESFAIREILKIPGKHNISNALGALMVGRALGIADEVSLGALADYNGAWRRFQIYEIGLGERGFTLVSDYAHHPTEITATFASVREKWPEKEIWAVFQPHQYQRTYYLFDKLVEVFSKSEAKKIIILPIYDVAGREEGEIKQKVDSLKLAEAIKERVENKEIFYLADFLEAKRFIENNIKGGEVVVIMGAGDVYDLVKKFST
ncbi:UDP-N-acetylmuramate--L-alanine ligase [Patescibacteria group bacterium]|nr:UDP-N-acetylmuramate--L-alanine ligase [Patescibacteria group bacterium]